MNKFRIEYVSFVIALTLLVGVSTVALNGMVKLLAYNSQAYNITLAICFVLTPVLIATTASIRRRMPNYGGRTPFSALFKIVLPMVALMLISTATNMTLWKFLEGFTMLYIKACAWTSLVMNSGIVLLCLKLIV